MFWMGVLLGDRLLLVTVGGGGSKKKTKMVASLEMERSVSEKEE